METTTSKSSERRLKKRYYLSRSQDNKCVYCGEEMWVKRYDPPGEPEREATLEHIIPQKHGGTERYDNIVCSCKECNNKRGHMPHDEFLKLRQQDNWNELLKKRRDARGAFYRSLNISS